MATEQSVGSGEEAAVGVVEWRAIQKEKERERRRLRDRERRQSMSVEEREKHLERRRRNYQLRRQRAAAAAAAANAKQEQVNFTTQSAAESSVRSDYCQAQAQAQAQALDCAPNEVNQVQNDDAFDHHHLNHGENLALPGPYRYPRVLRLTQIKQLIRLLNSSSEKPCFGGSQENAADTRNGERAIPNGIPRKGIRLVHLKNLIRMLNSEISTTREQQNDSDKMKGGGGEECSSSMRRENNGGRDERALWNENEKTIDAIDENEQICADGMCCL